MTELAPLLAAFLNDYLGPQRGASVHTIKSYADSLRLLVVYLAEKRNTTPSSLTIEEFNPDSILDFLEHLEVSRKNSVRTRNQRLAAIRCFFRYVEFRAPSCLQIAQQVRALPSKRCSRKLVDFLEMEEMEALLCAPDVRSKAGIRDRAMLYMGYATGLRVSELLGLRFEDFESNFRKVKIRGKGKRMRTLPVRKEARSALRRYIEILGGRASGVVFVNSQGGQLTRSGFAARLIKYQRIAAKRESSLTEKLLTPHTLRHTCAMHVLRATKDIRKVALWLGHERLETTEHYLHCDTTEKLDILTTIVPPELEKGTFNLEDDPLVGVLRSVGRGSFEYPFGSRGKA